jgi:hypothetical protein
MSSEECRNFLLDAGLGWVVAASGSFIFPQLQYNYRIAYGMAPTTPPWAKEHLTKAASFRSIS